MTVEIPADYPSHDRSTASLCGVDAVGLQTRASELAKRSLKAKSKQRAIDLAISMVDLTTLEGADTTAKVRALTAKALRPDPSDPNCPSVAAVCVYPDRVADVQSVLAAANPAESGSVGPRVQIAAVATAFPSGRAGLEVKRADTAEAIAAGADEVDMVIDRGAFLAGDLPLVYAQIVQIKQLCMDAGPRPVHLKVILETGELQTYDNVRRASWLAMDAGADFIKTSTGKVQPAATLPVTLLMLQAVRDYRKTTGRQVGVKPAGGIRTTKEALSYLVAVNETCGADWLDPRWFRFGASSLLNDLLLQRQKLATGRYSGPNYVTLD